VKKYASYGLFLLVFLLFAGCTVYDTVIRERNAETYARHEITEAKIRAKFIEDPSVKAMDVSVYVYGNKAFLVGEYDSPYQRDRATMLAGSATGVKSVTAYLLPAVKDDRCKPADNSRITQEVKAKIIRDSGIWSSNVDVKSVHCNAVLLGVVGSEKQIGKAVDHAFSISGVKGVKSFLMSAQEEKTPVAKK
jgi:hyperosmotically inducible protein